LCHFFVFSQTANFNYSTVDNSFCAPATVKFTSIASTNPVGYLWDFGNGIKSNESNPSIVFNAGIYNVRLIIVFEKKTAEISKVITIKANSQANILSDKDKLCTPSPVQFSSTNTVGSTYIWNFGDSSGNLTTTNSNILHRYSRFGNFNSTVSVINANGCVAKDTMLISITAPSITGTFSSYNGCVPATNQFSSSVILNNTGSHVVNYNWDFGDGHSITNADSTISHIYFNQGNYQPKLSITTNDGCQQSFIFDTVKYGTRPISITGFAERPTYCGSEKAKLIAHAENANIYKWMTGINNSITTVDTIIEIKFTTLGTKNIKVIPLFNNCPGDTTNIQVNIVGTIAKFNFQNSCSDKKTFQFSNASIGRNLNYNWKFGDGTTESLLSNPLKTFSANGQFYTSLKVTDPISGCKDSISTIIYTAEPNLSNTALQICVNSNTQFIILNNYDNPNARYTWKVMGSQVGPNRDTFQSIYATELGRYQNYVIIDNGTSYCKDTVVLDHDILVKGPVVNFTAEDNNCLDKPVSIINLTTSYLSGDNINHYSWDFGDSSLLFMGHQPDHVKYQKAGAYNIRLVATDNNGCTDTLTKTINVRPMPFIWILPRDAAYCSGSRYTIFGYTSDSLIWNSTNPIQGLCNSCDTNLISFYSNTNLYATAKNIYNCISRDTISIKVFEPFTANSSLPNLYVCNNQTVNLDVSPADKTVVWEPAIEIDNATTYQPLISPTNSRIYKATLTDSLGCFSSVSEINVKLKSNPTINLDPTKFLPYHSNYTIMPVYSSNVQLYEWSPAIDLSCGNCPNPELYVEGTKACTVKVTSDSGCTSTATINIAVECNNAYLTMPNAFTPNNDGTNDIFYPIATGIRQIKRFAIYNRNSQLIFEKTNFSANERNFGWNGKFNNSPQPFGTYVYLIEAVCDFGQTTIKKGSFLLLR
jgi:gliding motility-associated-like protein